MLAIGLLKPRQLGNTRAHQVAQKSTRTYLPRSESRLTALPVKSWASNDGAGLPTLSSRFSSFAALS